MSLSKTSSINLHLTKSGNKVQIGLPTLCNYDDDSDEEEECTNPNLKNVKTQQIQSEVAPLTKKPTTGLLSILPPPKSNTFIKPSTSASSSGTSSFMSNVKFSSDAKQLIPHAVKNKKASNDEDDDKSHFKKFKRSQPVKPVYVDKPDPVIGGDDEEEEQFDDEGRDEEENTDDQPQVPNPIDAATMNQEAWSKLTGGGRKNKLENIQITDIKVNDLIGDNQANLMKQLTSNYKPPSNRDFFGSGSKKKHQITYLAYVAKEREEELKNTWAQSKFNKQQSRQRYGF